MFIAFPSWASEQCLSQKQLNYFGERARKLGADVGYAISIFGLKDGQRLCQHLYRADGPIYPASVIKIFIVAAALKAVDQGKFSLDQQITITQSNANTDCLGPCGGWAYGVSGTLRKLLSDTIIASNNITTNQLIDLLGREQITKFAKFMGAQRTAVYRKLYANVDPEPQILLRNHTTANDLVTFFYQLYFNQNFLERDSRQFLIDLLARPRHKYLSQSIYHRYNFWHKTGTTSRASADAGFLIWENKLVIMTTLQESQVTPSGRWDFHQLNQMGEWMITSLENFELNSEP